MAKAEEQLREMESLLAELLQTARALKDVSSREISEEELMPLQDRQEELIEEIAKIDRSLARMKDKSFKETPNWVNVQGALVKFQELNDQFIENMKVRKGLIDFDLKDVRKTRKAMAGLKESYGRSKAPKKSPPSKSINTVL